MYFRLRFMAATLGAGLLFMAGQAAATTITTTTFNTWNSSAFITGPPTELPFTISLAGGYPTGVTLGGFLFTGPSLAATSTGTPALTASSITVATPSGGENAILFHTRNDANFTLTLSDNEVFSGLALGNFGFSSSSEITSLTLSAVSGSVTIDDFFYATSSQPQDPPQTIEGATFALVGGGLLILLGSRRKLIAKFAF